MFQYFCGVRLSPFIQEFLDLLPQSCGPHILTLLVPGTPTMSAFLRIADGNIMLLYVFSLLGYK